MDTEYREKIKDKKRIVVKVGTSSLIHKETGGLDLIKVEHLVRELSDLHNQGKDVILVTSGAIGVGRKAAGLTEKPDSIPMKQACAAIGQARLMMIYQKFFAEYNQVAAQILMTRNTMINPKNRRHAQDTFGELLNLGAIPVVNANDSISTFEILHGDNDTLSAIVASLVDADLLILLSDINGLYTDNPNTNPDAEFGPLRGISERGSDGDGKGCSEQRGNRRHGHQAYRGGACHCGRRGYADCQRRRYERHSQDRGWRAVWNLFPGT